MRKFLAILVGKLLIFISRVLKVGGGSALPGLVAEKIDPNILKKLTQKFSSGSIIITGTNGKTTTAAILASILKAAGKNVVHNYTGSNLTRGLNSTLIEKASFFGKIKADIGLFEVDEATIPEAALKIQPRAIIILNLFRDQLDRYGELEKTKDLIGRGIFLSPGSQVILNADDPLVASLKEDAKREVLFFGVENETYTQKEQHFHSADSLDCPRCGQEFLYTAKFFGHTGKYQCLKCGYTRPTPQVKVQQLKLWGMEGSDMAIEVQGTTLELKNTIAGFYNVYNILAATAVAFSLEIPLEVIKRGVESFSSAFGRLEKIKIGSKNLYLLLIKNPSGFSEVVETLVADSKPKSLLIALNDNFADGTDVSWIWDTNLELLKNHYRFITVSGIRAYDMVLRLKYADLAGNIDIEENLETAVQKSLEKVEDGEYLYLLPTYTAMLDIRNWLTKKGIVLPFWKIK